MMDRSAPLLPAGKVALLRFSDGSVDLGGVLYYQGEQGQLIPVPPSDPLFEVHEEWKREAARLAAASRPNRAARRAPGRKKSRPARRKSKKGVRHG